MQLKNFSVLAGNLIIISILIFTYVIKSYSQKPVDKMLGYEVLYDVAPDISGCRAGQLKSTEKQAILDEVNRIRGIHGLPLVTYNSGLDDRCARAALMIAANDNAPDNPHTPPSSWSCWTQEGRNGTERCNLNFNWFQGSSYPSSKSSVYNWMMDNGVGDCGHRRWIIDPALKYISFGRADGQSKMYPGSNVSTMTLHVINDDKQSMSGWDSNFVAYPYHNYPKEYYFESDGSNWYMSFTAVFDKSNYNNNVNVNYDNAVVTVKYFPGGTPIEVAKFTKEQFIVNNQGYGIPNALLWKIDGIQQNEKYTVTIENVNCNGTIKSYSYWFAIGNVKIDPPDIPQLDLPKNNASKQDLELTLSWLAASRAESYTLQISTSPKFDKDLKEFKGVSGLSQLVTELKDNTRYVWRVLAENSSGKSDWSDVWQFTTKIIPPLAPVLLLPIDAELHAGFAPKLSWMTAVNATKYFVQVSNFKTFEPSQLFINDSTADTTYSIPENKLYKNAIYYWRVKASGTAGYGEFSSPRSFTTAEGTWVEDLPAENNIISIFPNPSSGKFTCVFNSEVNGKFKFAIYNSYGLEIQQKIYDLTITKHVSIDLSPYPDGIYWLKLDLPDKSDSYQLVKLR